jgi:hypothetical protein
MVLAMKDVYWQMLLDQESSYLTYTPFGRFRFKRMPFGITPVSDIQQKCNQPIYGDIPRVPHGIPEELVADNMP